MPIPTKAKALRRCSFFLLFFFFFYLSLATAVAAASSDALSLISFQAKADTNHNLPFFSTHQRFGFCHWPGVKCVRAKVVRLVLDGFHLGGVFAPNTLSQLDQLRVLSLRNNSLSGAVPDISGLVNLKTLFLDHNSFSGAFPPSILALRRLRNLDLSHNQFSGSIPPGLAGLQDALYIRLEFNRFTGLVPPLNQTFLFVFNVSSNNLTGAVPVTAALSRFGESSFSLNPGLCGEILQKECSSSLTFFKPWESAPATPPSPAGQNGLDQQLQVAQLQPSNPKRHPKIALIAGFAVVSLVLVGSLLTVVMSMKKRRKLQEKGSLMPRKSASDYSSTATCTTTTTATAPPVKISVSEEEEEEGDKCRITKSRIPPQDTAKSGTLVFCAGEAQVYSLEQLMRGSAELLGRGSIGSTYKAVLDGTVTVTVKRLDGNKTCVSSRAMFERHIVSVSSLRHPNLVPLRAYFQALDREERLLIYDYQSNGSVFSLIHGARSARAKPLHWTSCLKIAEDVANGLSYIHQTVRLVHGNLKASNVLLGAEFEALLTDYCLTVFARSSDSEETNLSSSASYKAPELKKKGGHESSSCSTKSDVYAFGVLVLELLTGKLPSQLPVLMPATELLNWVRAAREEEGVEDKWMEMLVEIVSECCRTSPEQRPSMWQVLKMIQEIKEIVTAEEDSSSVFCS